MNTANKLNVDEIAQAAIEIATIKGSTSRGKAFKAAYERVETQYGKSALDESTKKQVQRAVDEALKAKATITAGEVIHRRATYEQVNTHGEYERGQKITTLDNGCIDPEEQLLGMSRVLSEHRRKMAAKEEGATESDVRKERRIRNAILGLLDDMRKHNKHNTDAWTNIKKFMTGLPALNSTSLDSVTAPLINA
jgi:hypothetical protein